MKKRIGSVLLALALCLSLLPATALAEDTGGTGTSVNVKTVEEFKNALNNNDATKIHITGDIRYSDSLNSSKTIYIDNGATLTLSAPNATVSGTIVNNGTIKVTSKRRCLWKATTTGTGKLVGGTDSWNSPSTYVDYGCVPDTMLEGSNCLINIVKDITKAPVASLPTSMQTGNTINVTVSNLIDHVDLSKVFNFKWMDGSSFEIYNNATTPTLTKAGKLKLTLQPKTGYIMLTSSGYNSSLGAEGTVKQKTVNTVYVDSTNGNDSNLGDFVADGNVVTPEGNVESVMLREHIDALLGDLKERERQVIILRFGLEDGHPRTLEEVGKKFDVTRERIRQIEAKALRKLRHPSRSRKLKDYLD